MDWNSCVENVTDTHGNFLGQAATLNCIPVLFGNLVNAALIFAGSIAVILIIWAGIRFITSGGDAKKAESARKTITWAIVGLLIIIFAFTIVNTLANITGAHCIAQWNGFSFQNCATNITGNN